MESCVQLVPFDGVQYPNWTKLVERNLRGLHDSIQKSKPYSTAPLLNSIKHLVETEPIIMANHDLYWGHMSQMTWVLIIAHLSFAEIYVGF